MIRKIKTKDRYLAKHEWLTSYHLFSFADYYDVNNMNFGALRVFNDDIIDGENGFGAHSHRDMEIVTIMLSGELIHHDSIGNSAKMVSGEAQYMSAGSGVTHSEVNRGKDSTHLYQIWLTPKQKGMPPTYNQKNFKLSENKNMLVPVVSDTVKGEAMLVQTNATVYIANFETGKNVDYKIQNSRGVFIYVTTRVLEINNIEFMTGDQARVEQQEILMILAKEGSEFVLVDTVL